MSTEICHKTLRLEESDLDNQDSCCSACNNARGTVVEVVVQREPDVMYMTCDHCGASSVSRMPTDSYLHAYYASYYNSHDKNVTFRGEERFARHILQLIPVNELQGSIRILDFGGGDGSLAYALACQVKKSRQDCDIHICVVDYGTDNIATNEFKIQYCRDISEISGTFNIVIASAVLEHIKYPHKIIDKLFSVLDKPGFFYARTPFSLPFKKVFPNFELSYPMHLHDMGNVYWDRFVDTYNIADCILLNSQPSIVSTEFSNAALVTAVAYALKLPARIERRLSGRRGKQLFWPFVGGWEAIIGRV